MKAAGCSIRVPEMGLASRARGYVDMDGRLSRRAKRRARGRAMVRAWPTDRSLRGRLPPRQARRLRPLRLADRPRGLQLACLSDVAVQLLDIARDNRGGRDEVLHRRRAVRL